MMDEALLKGTWPCNQLKIDDTIGRAWHITSASTSRLTRLSRYDTGTQIHATENDTSMVVISCYFWNTLRTRTSSPILHSPTAH